RALALICNRVASTDHCLSALADDALEPAVFRVQAPGKADARSEVIFVGCVSLVAVLELDELRGTASLYVVIEMIVWPSDPEQTVSGGCRVNAVSHSEGKLHLVTQSAGECQVRSRSPGILPEEPPFTLAATPNLRSQILVLVGLIIQSGISRDG